MKQFARVSAMAVALAATFLLACSSGARRGPSRYPQKLVILGFDGMDPHLLERWMAEGKLPNIAKLAHQGGFYPLGTTHSPESPTAWASFATGMNAGKHNIYDFLVRDTSTYLPDLGMVKRTPPKFLFNYFPISKPKLESTRGGTSFWVVGGRAGVRSDILTVPVTFPPEEVPERRAVVGPAAARYPGHDGHVLLLRDRSEPLRGGEHGDGRHPQAPGVRGGYRQRPSSRDRRARSSGSRSRRFGSVGRARATAIARASRSCRPRRTSGCR